ncbi:MAG: glycosyltransferase [Treponema sp.]|nr:glycosyltransferase [Treponema sp.]MBR1405262.1 glycosyltransferase [Treponema sp.]
MFLGRILDYTYIHLNRYSRFFKKIRYEKFKNETVRFVEESDFQYGICNEPREKKIIISLTTYPARFDTLRLCLKSLLLQTVKPNKIIIYLGDDCKNSPLTELEFFKQYGIDIVIKDEDLKSHKKYFYAMQEYPNDIIITVDDDSIYPANLVENLLNAHEKNADCVVANRVHKIMRKLDGSLHSYNDWLNNYMGATQPSYNLIATGCGGVLYPPHCLDERAFDKEKIIQFCLTADDIWLKFMETLHGTKVVWAKNSCPEPYTIQNSKSTPLYLENVGKFKNNMYIERLKNLYTIEIDNRFNA